MSAVSDSVWLHRRQPTRLPRPGVLQARTLDWVAISFSNAWKWKVKVKSLSGVWLFATLWTAAHQAPPSVGFSRQENWSGLPLPSLLDQVNIYKIVVWVLLVSENLVIWCDRLQQSWLSGKYVFILFEIFYGQVDFLGVGNQITFT